MNDSLDIMNTISARKYKNTKRMTQITMIARTVCETMKVEIPEEVREGLEICDLDTLP